MKNGWTETARSRAVRENEDASSRPSLVPDICPTRCDIVRHGTPLLRANTFLKFNKNNQLQGLVHNGIVEVVGSKPSGSTNFSALNQIVSRRCWQTEKPH